MIREVRDLLTYFKVNNFDIIKDGINKFDYLTVYFKNINDKNKLKFFINNLGKKLIYIHSRKDYFKKEYVLNSKDDNLQFFFFSFNHIQYLIESHFNKIISDKKLIFFTNILLNDFIKIDLVENINISKYVVGDHTTAMRLFNLCLLSFYCFKINLDNHHITNKLLSLIQLHIDILSVEKFYYKFTNHGVDQMIYGYFACIYLNRLGVKNYNSQYFKNNLIEELDHSITADFIHIENTPAYHSYFIDQLIKVRTLFKVIDKTLYMQASGILDRMFEYIVYFIKPNFKHPLIGDEGSYYLTKKNINFLTDKYYKIYQKLLKCMENKKRITNINLPTIKIWKDSGYMVYKSDWKNLNNQIYFFIKSSYHSKFHKHQDNNSFVLHAYNEDWVIDSGLYKFDSFDRFRKYMISPHAHNIFVLPNDSYLNKHMYSCGIKSFKCTDKNSCNVIFFNKMYANMLYKRGVTIHNDRIILEDQLEDVPTAYGYSLIHIPLDKRIIKNNRGFVIKSKTCKKKLFIHIESNNKYCSSIIKGDGGEEGNKTSLISFVSYQYNKLEESYCLAIKFFKDSKSKIKYKIIMHF